MEDDEELLDLVDQNDKVIGTIKRQAAPELVSSHKGYIRGSVCFIKNTRGQLWIPRRTADKKIAPNGLDFSVAEHVQSKESYLDAIIRGFKEEVYLTIKKSDLTNLGVLRPVAQKPYFFTGVFLFRADEVKKYNPDDFSDASWLLPKEVLALIENGEPAKNALKAALQTYLI